MSLICTGRAQRSYKDLDRSTASRTVQALDLLATNPMYPSLRFKKLNSARRVRNHTRGPEDVFTIRASRKHRVLLAKRSEGWVVLDIVARNDRAVYHGEA